MCKNGNWHSEWTCTCTVEPLYLWVSSSGPQWSVLIKEVSLFERESSILFHILALLKFRVKEMSELFWRSSSMGRFHCILSAVCKPWNNENSIFMTVGVTCYPMQSWFVKFAYIRWIISIRTTRRLLRHILAWKRLHVYCWSLRKYIARKCVCMQYYLVWLIFCHPCPCGMLITLVALMLGNCCHVCACCVVLLSVAS